MFDIFHIFDIFHTWYMLTIVASSLTCMLYLILLSGLMQTRVHMQCILIGYVQHIAQLARVGDVQYANAIGQAHIQFLSEEEEEQKCE